MPLESTVMQWITDSWQAVAAATVMLAVLGLTIALLLRRVAVDSWRLRSWLLAAVLLQGLVICRVPLHLGLLESPEKADEITRASELDADWNRLPDALPIGSDATPSPTTADETQSNATPRAGWLERVNWTQAFGLVWLSVVLLLVACSCWKYARLVRLVGQLERAPVSWERQWQLVQRRLLGDRRGYSEMRVSKSAGPLVIRCPRDYSLVVPKDFWQSLGEDQRSGILVHECAHMQRHDVWRQLVARVVATIHWFNPIAWWAVREHEQVSELACDHAVARQGRQTAMGFATALVDLVQWHQQHRAASDINHGLGVQAMATPPLSDRISRLVTTSSRGDSSMKRILLTGAALAVAGLSLFQLRLSDAQTPGDETLSNTLPILTESTEQKLTSIRKQLNTDDPTTKRFDELIDSAAGKLALAGLLNQLTSSARNELRSDALSRFLEAHFDTVANGKLVLRPEHSEWVESWTSRGERINDYLTKLRETNDQLASEMDPDSDAGKLFKRLLEDPQSHAAILLVEMKHGGDAVDKFLAEALDKVLVERGDGTYQIVPSRREEAQKLIERLDLATELDQKLQRQMPAWSNEFDASDENHRRLIRYMSQPEMATVMALQISDDRDFASAAAAAEELFGRLETVSVDTPTGLRIERKEVWQQFDEIFRTVDRVTGLLAPIEERLTALSSTLATEDPLASKLKEHMRQRPLATLVAAELPYAAAEPGDQLRVMLDSVLVETSDGKLRVRDDHAEEVAEKAKQLLQACRTIRRHLISIDAMLERIEDQKLLSQLGDSRSYLILNEVKRYAEQQRFDSVELLKGSILVENADGRWQIDQQHRDIVRRLVEQAQQVADEASNDDF